MELGQGLHIGETALERAFIVDFYGHFPGGPPVSILWSFLGFSGVSLRFISAFSMVLKSRETTENCLVLFIIVYQEAPAE